MLLEHMFYASNLILGLGFRELRRLRVAIQYRAIRGKLGNFCKLMSIRGLFLRGSGWWWCIGDFLSCWDTDSVQRARSFQSTSVTTDFV